MAEKIVFSRSIYLPDAVQRATQAYGSLAQFVVQTADHEIVVQISEVHPHFQERLEELLDAFCNHALFETIVQDRQENGGTL